MQANTRRRTSGRASGPHDSQIGSSQANAEQSDHDSEVSVSSGDNPLALMDANVEKLINDVKDMIEVARAWQLDDPMLRPVQAEAQDIIRELLLLQTKIERCTNAPTRSLKRRARQSNSGIESSTFITDIPRFCSVN